MRTTEEELIQAIQEAMNQQPLEAGDGFMTTTEIVRASQGRHSEEQVRRALLYLKSKDLLEVERVWRDSLVGHSRVPAYRTKTTRQ